MKESFIDYSDMTNDFEEEKDEEESAIKPYEVDCLPNDYNITSLISLIERGYMKIPSFQRNYVWKRDMASKFIESIIIGLPIPQIFLFEKGRNNFLVIDGQQRLVTIYLFKKQRFPKNDKARGIIRKYLSAGKLIPDSELAKDDFEDFKLKLPSSDEQKNPLDNLKYNTLTSTDKYDFRGEFDFNRTIRTITIKQIEPYSDDSSMFEIFSRLNSGGVILKPQEIRMSIYYSEFYERLVSDFNLHPSWRRFLSKDNPDLHMSEVEVLVRAFAMLEMSAFYKAPLRHFLNDFSKKAMKFDTDKINRYAKLFDDFWSSCGDLPKEAFRNEKNKFVISLFEAVFVATCEIISREGLNGRRITLESVEKLKADSLFVNVSHGNTAGASSVSTRLERARLIIQIQ